MTDHDPMASWNAVARARSDDATSEMHEAEPYRAAVIVAVVVVVVSLIAVVVWVLS